MCGCPKRVLSAELGKYLFPILGFCSRENNVKFLQIIFTFMILFTFILFCSILNEGWTCADLHHRQQGLSQMEQISRSEIC